MIKALLSLLVIALLMPFSGCAGDAAARNTAESLSSEISTLQGEINKKIKAEKDSYEEMAKALHGARIDLLSNKQSTRRTERSLTCAHQYMDPSAQTTWATLWAMLLQASQEEYELYKKNWDREITTRAEVYLTLEELDNQSSRLEAVKKKLDKLREFNLLNELEFLMKYGEELQGKIKEERNKRGVKDLESTIKEYQKTKVKEGKGN